jgi:hypothetical protein
MTEFWQGYWAAKADQPRDPFKDPEWLRGYDNATELMKIGEVISTFFGYNR